MNSILMATVAAGLAATSPTGLVHHVEVPHGPGSVRVSYHGDVAVTHRQVGFSAGPRTSTARCTWTADMRVMRHVEGGAAPGLVKPVDGGQAAEGSRHGDCMTVRHTIADEVARAEPKMRAALADAADRDRAQLAVDLETHGHSLARLAR